jgi:thioredoxin reductase (NADPH)
MTAHPTILTVDDDPAARDLVIAMLRRRYGADYDVTAAADAAEAKAKLQGLHDGDADVALILAYHWMATETGTSFLGGTRDLFPTTRRLLMTTFADFTARQDIAHASTLGDIDHYAPRPLGPTDEQFLATIGDALAGWAHDHGRYEPLVTILGHEWDPASRSLWDTLERWGVPVDFVDVDSSAGKRRMAEPGIGHDLPAVLAADGRVLPPSLWKLAQAFGGNAEPLSDPFDLVVLGSGPGGLSAAVYGASEGLNVLLVEPESLGGQASSSPMIRNYLGFADGVSGSELLGRAWQQAWRFGVRSLIGRRACAIRADGDGQVVQFDDGSTVRTRSTIVASGLAYRRIGIPSVENLVGRGVFYGSGATEAQAMSGQPVAVIGGANSAAEAAIHLAKYAHSVTVLVRGKSLAGSVSDYLIDQLSDLPNGEVRVDTEVVDARDDRRLRSLVLRDRSTGKVDEIKTTALFILIGAAPRTDWLPPAIRRDPRGFVLTGDDAPPSGGRDGHRRALETTMTSVFAVGDVRHGSTKRIATAVGEGATAIRQILGESG